MIPSATIKEISFLINVSKLRSAPTILTVPNNYALKKLSTVFRELFFSAYPALKNNAEDAEKYAENRRVNYKLSHYPIHPDEIATTSSILFLFAIAT